MLSERFANVARMHAVMQASHRFSREIVPRGEAAFGEAWSRELETLLAALLPGDEALAAAARGYSKFAMHSMRLQAVFERERAYPAKTHAQASEEVYFNERHMREEYLPGLLLSHFLWPHHYRQLQFFDTAFVGAMRVAGASAFVEVGVGTGVYSARVLQQLPQARGLGLDISPSSKEFAENLTRALGLGERYRVELRDAVANPLPQPAPWLICVEVLEHLDDPVHFLRALRTQLAPGGKAFITAALNSAHTDHIYLYRDPEEVHAHLLAAGFHAEQAFAAQAYPPSAPGAPVPSAAAFVVV